MVLVILKHLIKLFESYSGHESVCEISTLVRVGESAREFRGETNGTGAHECERRSRMTAADTGACSGLNVPCIGQRLEHCVLGVDLMAEKAPSGLDWLCAMANVLCDTWRVNTGRGS